MTIEKKSLNRRLYQLCCESHVLTSKRSNFFLLLSIYAALGGLITANAIINIRNNVSERTDQRQQEV